MKRQNVNLEMDLYEVMAIMSEGNPGAISVLMNLLNHSPVGFMLILNLDDMNIRGEQIWLGYKDFCKEDIVRFGDCIRERNREMVDYINNYPYKSTTEVAVTSGGFKNRE